MKKYLVIGNPIEHSLSPELHNHWIKNNNINAIYEKKKIHENEIKEIIYKIKSEKINGINVTIPFKKTVITHLDGLTKSANETQSVNTIYKKENKIIGDNTDTLGFEKSLNHINYNPKGKNVFILGSGGVVSSIVVALKKLGASKIVLSNRTKKKAEDLKRRYSYIEILDWGTIADFDMIINATSLGLKNSDKLDLDFSKIGTDKLFYDIIYNPKKTNFLLKGAELGNKIENGKMMFIYQAQLAFKSWHNILPKIDSNIIKLLNT